MGRPPDPVHGDTARFSCVAGRTAPVTIQARDRYGNNLTRGGDRYVVRLMPATLARLQYPSIPASALPDGRANTGQARVPTIQGALDGGGGLTITEHAAAAAATDTATDTDTATALAALQASLSPSASAAGLPTYEPAVVDNGDGTYSAPYVPKVASPEYVMRIDLAQAGGLWVEIFRTPRPLASERVVPAKGVDLWTAPDAAALDAGGVPVE